MTTPDLIIFDNDGVLVDSERLSNRIFAALLTEAGLPTSFDDAVDRYMGRRSSDCVVDIEAQLGRSLPADFLHRYEHECASVISTELTTVDGVTDLLDALDDNKIPYCIASSGTPDEIALRLRTTGLTDRFGDRVYSGSMVARGKPAPDLFEYAAERMGFSPESAVVIEDSPAGVTGAKAAGAHVIGHADLVDPQRLVDAGAHVVVSGMGQVRSLLSI
ncbi:HAD superfamily hydrolase (TIGR01509 family) [Stackebrandtia endophytica]|uniref:HAD superfamily hydrolase (TIGR01509 family) n=1 Tax=Stackebrandtia endophytica TaxID=1496996 RepID=A0A543AWD4_9ACTN|nr:HAD-IA family hydrolase [Stackebrandtia endophytica]TQL76883.1 HAD superfamily hydrolase (TIGR01509 family) [Stackebrandtia endophytica]